MAARQMEEIQRKLGMLNYPRANAPARSLLFAGMERCALFEWLFFRLLGDKSPFSQQTLQGDTTDRVIETAQIHYVAEIAKVLGITTTIDTEAIQDSCSVDEQVAKDIQLIDSISEKQAQHAYNRDEEYAVVESQLRSHLESFLGAARSFNTIYTKEIRPRTHMIEVPQLHGFGLAANRLLEA